MTRLARLLLLVAWLIGVISGSFPATPDSMTATKNGYVVTQSDWGRLAVRNGEIVLRVGLVEAYWQMTTPAPASVETWLCPEEQTALSHPNPVPESTTFMPL